MSERSNRFIPEWLFWLIILGFTVEGIIQTNTKWVVFMGGLTWGVFSAYLLWVWVEKR